MENSEVILSTGVADPLDRAIIKYSNHPSIRRIRDFAQSDDSFKFQKVSLELMHTELGRLNPKKATTFKNIPAKVLKNSSEMCSESLQLIFNDCVQNGLFPDFETSGCHYPSQNGGENQEGKLQTRERFATRF